MELEFTARQVKVSKALRVQAEEGMQRIARVLGRTTRASFILRAQRHLQIVELTVQARALKIVAAGDGDSLESALRKAIAHAEHQALRHRDRRLESKRLPKEEKVLTAPPVTSKARAAHIDMAPDDEKPLSNGKARASIAVHSFPGRHAMVEPHITKSSEAIALRPMTIEEAVKDTEFRDRDLLIFRNAAGDMFVLHRRRDGQMELVEIP